MKKIMSLLLTLPMCFALASCGKGADVAADESGGQISANEESGSSDKTQSIDKDGNKILVAYFSRTGENYGVGYIDKGNTHIVADMIAEQVGADTFEISTVKTYPDKYDECTEEAKQEQEQNARPELTASVKNMADYNVVFLGYPIWWSDMPMAVYTFLESYDFSGKTIVPFCTHEGSGISSTQESIAEVCPDSKVLQGLELKGSTAQNSQDEASKAVADWLENLDYKSK